MEGPVVGLGQRVMNDGSRSSGEVSRKKKRAWAREIVRVGLEELAVVLKTNTQLWKTSGE